MSNRTWVGSLTPLVTILQHEAAAPPALLGRFLSQAGLRLDVRRIDRGDQVPSGLSGSDALVVLGGDMNVGEEADHPFLLAERELLSEAVRSGVPTLGICLGAQQLATAAGGGVTRRDALGLGWHAIAVQSDDDLVDGIDRQTLVFQWRQYACRLPAQAELIATGEGDPQIFRLGDAAWGVQFHPEVTFEVLTGWIDEDQPIVERAAPGGRDGLLAECRRRLPASTALCGRLVANFLAATGLAPA
jgi:GMP synthase-like glutamine amidotransferase